MLFSPNPEMASDIAPLQQGPLTPRLGGCQTACLGVGLHHHDNVNGHERRKGTGDETATCPEDTRISQQPQG